MSRWAVTSIKQIKELGLISELETTLNGNQYQPQGETNANEGDYRSLIRRGRGGGKCLNYTKNNFILWSLSSVCPPWRLSTPLC